METLTPICPVCKENYDNIIKPYSMQPCGHGICKECFSQMENLNTRLQPLSCPVCRSDIIICKPNYDLKKITDEISNQADPEEWIIRLYEIKQNVTNVIHEDMKKYCKLIVLRVLLKDHFDMMADLESEEWTSEDKIIIKDIKSEIVKIISNHNDDIEEVIKWIKTMSFPLYLEGYLRRFIKRVYDNKDFLSLTQSEWILDLFVQPV
jgi:hypothetical protein